MENKVKSGIKKALIYAVLFAVILSFPVFICLTKNRNIFEIFANAVMPIYMAAVTVILYPFFRVKSAAFPYFSLLTLCACAVIGVPIYIFVGMKCESFGIGTGLAYVIYGMIVGIALGAITLLDAAITFTVRLIKRKKCRILPENVDNNNRM